MPEALARSHNDSVLSRAARSARFDPRGVSRTVLRRLMARPARTIAGAALAAVLTGIVVNALLMQKERVAAPLFAAPRQAAHSSPVAAQPPARPAGLGTALDAPPVPPSRSDDPIRDLLRGDTAKEAGHLTLAAQNALIKLGFAIKADGVMGASTEQAIQQFERAHGLAPSVEITARLVRQLSTAANAAGR